jgi:hypothetical protein
MESIEALRVLQRVMNDRFGQELAVDPADFAWHGRGADLVLPSLPVKKALSPTDPATNGARRKASGRSAGAARRGGGLQSVESRDDAIKALQMICAYLERSEPTNPAQLLLRRAERLIDKSFPAARARLGARRGQRSGAHHGVWIRTASRPSSEPRSQRVDRRALRLSTKNCLHTGRRRSLVSGLQQRRPFTVI